MENLKFNLLWCFCWCIGKLPQFMQFAMGDFIYFILYYIVGYRKKVVRENLTRSFPDKSLAEIIKVEKKFFLQLADIMVESLALVSISEKQIRERMIYENPEVLNETASERAVIAAMAHFASWEYTVSSKLFFSAPTLAVYHPLSSKTVDKLYKKMRARFGVKPVPMLLTYRELILHVRAKNYPVLALIADQIPAKVKIRNWTHFLNQDTAFFTGMERLAVSMHCAVYFTEITQTKRGYYSCRFELIYDGEEKLEEDELTRRYAAKLEEMIVKEPHLWMWSHRRWKWHPSDFA